MKVHVRAGRARCTAGALLTALLVAPLYASALAIGSPVGSGASPVRWQSVTGQRFDSTAFARSKATVFLFLSSECPVCNLYTPRILDLYRRYHSRGVPFFLIGSNSDDTAASLARYARSRSYPFPVVKDHGTQLADWLGAVFTPEAIVVDSSGDVRYRGRIDDNRDRSKVIRHDLSEALDEVLAGRPVTRPRTLAFGCRIFRDSPAPVTRVASSVTYVHDIAPILYQNCVACHRPGEAGPFPLLTYQQARTFASLIKDYTGHRVMPPWKAVPGYGDFKDARYLTDHQIALIARWADSGTPQGNPKLTPPLPHFPPAGAWRLGTPDLILRSARPFSIPAEGSDIYREFVLPADWPTDRFLSAIELRPDNRAVVHHVILYLDPTGEAEKLEGADGQPGYTVRGVGIYPPASRLNGKEIFASGWAAGNTPARLPEGTAIRVPAHAKLVLQVHYHLDGKPELDNTSVGLHFADPAKVDKVMRVEGLVNYRFDLKPGLAHQVVTQSLVVPGPVHLYAVSPHMHLLGRSMKLTATFPDGSVKPLILVNDWDFNWQESYRYKTPIALPKGTRIDMTAVFDNSDSNPRQSFHPPHDVRWGEQTTDEMCIGFLTFTVDSQHLAGRAGPSVRPSALR